MSIKRPARLMTGFLLLGALGCAAPPEPALAPQPAPAERVDGRLDIIAFGSCNDQRREQPLWSAILESQPDLWVWLGDNIYASTEDMAAMWEMYEEQLANPWYATVRRRIPVIGTWDDYDYGGKDAGKEYPRRAESQQLLLNFLGVPEDSPRRTREGVYSAHTYGPEGQRVKVILLDVRYHRDPIGSDADVLGEDQWRWLERELRESDAQVHLIGSGIQVLPVDHEYEKWADFPRERERLLQLIGETGAPGVVLLSGDRHIAEIMRLDDPRIGYPLYEVTSSGMTHVWADADEPNRFRVGDLVTVLNFGVIQFDWDAEPARLGLQIRDRYNWIRDEQWIELPASAQSARSATSGSTRVARRAGT